MPPPQPEWTIVDFIHRGYWWTNRGILLLNICLLVPLLTASINGLDSSLVNGLQIIPAWQEHYQHPNGKTLGLISAAQAIGGLVGLPFAPFASDILGRRLTLWIGSLVILAGVGLQLTATVVSVFIGARSLIGLGLSFCLNSAPLLLIELSYPTQRGKITGLYNSSWYIGSIISAWACLIAYAQARGGWSYKVPTLIQALGPIIQVCLIWFIPESPRYLVSRGREAEAARILSKYHANGNDDRDPLVIFELEQIKHALRMEAEINRNTSYFSLFKTPGNRKRMGIIIAIASFSQLSGNGLVSYYINSILEGVGITGTEAKASINGGLQLFNFIAAVGGSMCVDRIGRRSLFIISTTGMLASFSMWTMTTALFNTSGNTAAAKATIPLIFIFFFFYDVAFTPLLIVYTLEILPFRIRAKGFAVMNLTVNLTSAFNQFINPWALQALGWKYYLVYCGWLIFELTFILINIVETRGRTLEETAALFDGEQNQQDLAMFGGDAATMTMSRAAMASEHLLSGSDEQLGHADEKDVESYEMKGKQRVRFASKSEHGDIGYAI